MKYVTMITKFRIDEEEHSISCDEVLDNAIDVIQENFGEIGADGADYYAKDHESDYVGDGKTVLINLSNCSNEHPVSVSDIQTIAIALSLPDTKEVIIACYGVELTIQKDIEGYYEYVVGDKRFDNAYEAAVQAITHYYEIGVPRESFGL